MPEFRRDALEAVCREHGIDLVFTAGAEMAHLAAALPAGRHADHALSGDELAERVIAALASGDVVMVKGSNASGMASVVAALRAAAAEAESMAQA